MRRSVSTNLFFKDKFKFLRDAYTSASVQARNIREYIDRNIPDRFRSISNIFNLSIDVAQDISTMHMLHHEDALNELNIFTAQHEGNIRGHSQLTGHTPVLPISARGVVRMDVIKPGLEEFGNSLQILSSAVFRNLTNGQDYVLDRTVDVRFQTNTPSKFVTLIQGRRATQTFTIDTNISTTGDALYTIDLDDNQPIEHYSIQVYVNNELWSKADSLYDMSGESKEYLQRVGYGNQIDIIFGNGRQGRRMRTGDVVRIDYLITSGERGNAQQNHIFEIQSGIQDIQGNEIQATEFFRITPESGFNLGSNGEDPETTRTMTGFSSRSLTFSRPENLIAFLSRLSILSHIDAWTEEDDLVFNILALPRIQLANSSDYLRLSETRFTLTEAQKTSILQMIEASRRQWVSTEFVFRDPTIKKYVTFIYIEGQIFDRIEFRNTIETLVSDLILSKTFGDVDKDASNDNITRSDMINAIHDLPDVDSIAIDILSEDNENARIQGWYLKDEVENIGGVRKKVQRRINLVGDENPRLGLSEVGNITTLQNEVPIIRGGFDMYQENGTHETLPENGVIIYIKENNEWIQI